MLQREGWRILASGSGPGSALAGGNPPNPAYAGCDLRDLIAPERLVKSAIDHFGRIDGLVHCVGGSFVDPFPGQNDDAGKPSSTSTCPPRTG